MIKITSTNDVIIVEGDELTRHYPYNGTLVIPKNSTLVLLDESSEMVLFKSASNYDTLFTGILGSISIEDEIVTRENIIEKFNAISNVIQGGGNVDLFEVVQSLPTENISDNKVYLVLDSNGSEGNTYVEYLYVNGQWEELGKFKVNVDLSEYATEQWVNSQGFLKEHQDISNLATKEELNAKQDTINDLETIRSGAALGATALQSVPDTYATEQWVNSQGFLKEHQDISNLATKDELNAKQDVINDLETIRSGAALGATALQSVPSTYALKTDIPDITTKQDTLVSGTNIKTINGTSLLGSGDITIDTNVDLTGYATEQWVNEQGFIKEHQDISNLATKEELNAKQDVINDLETIRSGAAKGATALQEVPSEYVTETELNNKGYLTSVPDTYALKSEIPDITTKQDTLVSGTNIKTINGTSLLGSGDITIEGGSGNVDLSDYYTKTETNELVNPKLEQVTLTQAEYDALQTKEYNVLYIISDSEDLKFKTINGQQITGDGDITIDTNVDLSNYATKSELNTKQDVINDLDTIRSGASKGATALQSVPSGYATEQWVNEQGFLKEHQDISNLATKDELNAKQDVITDLETIRSGAAKGATALQSVPDTYALKSEIPDINTKQDTLVSGTNIKTVNGTSLLGSGNIEISTDVDLSSYATKEELNAKQDTLVSGTNIKTVNGTSLLGEGNITISGEGGADLSRYYTKAEIDEMIGGASTTITQINDLVG